MGLVLLTILKIIGIIVASIIGIIILLLLLVLFSPVRYKGRLKYDGEPDITLKVSWLCNIIRASVMLHGDEQKITFKVFFKDLMKGRRKAPKDKAKTKSKTKTATIEQEISPQQSQQQQTPPQPAKDEIQPEFPIETIEKKPTGKKSKKSVFKILKDIYNNIRAFFIRLWASIKNMLDKRDKIITMINDTRNRDAVSFTTAILKKFLQHILPRKHKVFLTYGTGEPDTTGQTVGYAYAAAALLGVNLIIEPDFENKVFNLDMPFKGRVCTLRLLIWFLQVYRHKNLKRLIHQIQSGI